MRYSKRLLSEERKEEEMEVKITTVPSLKMKIS